jgi:hypothetical protein
MNGEIEGKTYLDKEDEDLVSLSVKLLDRKGDIIF